MAFAFAQADRQPAGDPYPRGDAGMAARLDDVFDHPLRTTESELLSIRELRVRFGGLAALSGVNLSVGHHDLIAIIGPNGAGKSTTLNAICQLIRSSGEITFNGRRIDGLPAWKIAAAGIGRRTCSAGRTCACATACSPRSGGAAVSSATRRR
jgi:hypothetical protein